MKILENVKRFSLELQKWAKITNVHIITSVNDQKQENEVKKKTILVCFFVVVVVAIQRKKRRGCIFSNCNKNNNKYFGCLVFGHRLM